MRRLKKICKTLMIFISMALLPSALDADTIENIQKRGTLILGTSGTMAPMTHALMSGGATGFDVDIAQTMAATMHVKLEVKIVAFEKLLDELEKGNVDVVISNMTMTSERNLKVAFVGPYLTSGKCIITKESTIAAAQKAEDINHVHPTMAVLKGTTTEAFVKTMLPAVKPILVNSQDEGVELVKSGKVQTMMSEYPTCAMVVSANKDSGFVAEFSNLTYDPIGIAIQGDDAHMINYTQNFLMRLERTGALQALALKWLGDLAKIK